MSRRRLLAVLLVGALAVPGLVACRDLPTVAAYVGSVQLTNAEVEEIFGSFPAETQDKFSGAIRRDVVTFFVTREVARDLAKENGVTVPETDLSRYAAFAQRYQLPADRGYVKLEAEADTALTALRSLGRPQAPTEADKQETFQELVKDQVVPPGSFEAVKSQIDSPQMRAALGLRPVLSDALKRYHVSINPRYEPLGIPVPFGLGSNQAVTASVTLPLTPAGTPAVRDLSS